MKSRTSTSRSVSGQRYSWVALGLFGLIAPTLTFMLAISGLSERVKIFVLVILAAGYSAICFWSFRKAHIGSETAALEPRSNDSRDDGLKSIGEAAEFFGSSLKPGDMFRLVASRIDHVFPFQDSALFVATESGEHLEIVQADGPNGKHLLGSKSPLGQGTAGMSWVSGEVEVDVDLKSERASLPPDALEGSSSAAAIPLLHDGQAFAVIVLYTSGRLIADAETIRILQLIGERVTPLFLGSISLERSISNALTDSVTRLPNERAFYMVLENQLAESQRFRNERPLTILAVDIKDFADANQNFGYAVGDRMLAFTAEHLASQLRKMDFLSRSGSDEFLVILPTASEKLVGEIIDRIKEKFAAVQFQLTDTDETKVWLNFGSATFWQDGETAEQLLQHARVRKQQAKAEDSGKVIWFPKEYVN